MFYEEGDEQIRKRRKHRTVAESEEAIGDDAIEDIPIDILENMRNRTPREHCSDEAVGKEIERR